MQNTQRATNAIESPAPASTLRPATTEDVWAVWPYCWITAGWDLASSRFHSFHTKRSEWQLARQNRRAQAQFWRGWNQEASSSELELRLL